jgi:hypothetical protein
MRMRQRQDVVHERGVPDGALRPDERQVGVQQQNAIHLPRSEAEERNVEWQKQALEKKTPYARAGERDTLHRRAAGAGEVGSDRDDRFSSLSSS